MSELKVYMKHLKTNMFGETIVCQSYYIKSQADKVIAEKDAEIDKLNDKLRHYPMMVTLLENDKKEIAEKDKELLYHKYKRCLAMAEMCNARYDEEDAKVNGYGASWEYISRKMKYWERWRWRWDALAEKLKERKNDED